MFWYLRSIDYLRFLVPLAVFLDDGLRLPPLANGAAFLPLKFEIGITASSALSLSLCACALLRPALPFSSCRASCVRLRLQQHWDSVRRCDVRKLQPL